MSLLYPAIGKWYQDTSALHLFEVVALDEKNGTIEIQYEGGEIDEFDFDSWEELHLIAAAPPEDGNAGYGFSAEDHWSEKHSIDFNCNNPLEMIEPETFQDFDDF